MGNNGKRQHIKRVSPTQWAQLCKEIEQAEQVLLEIKSRGDLGGFRPDLTGAQSSIDSLLVSRVKLAASEFDL